LFNKTKTKDVAKTETKDNVETWAKDEAETEPKNDGEREINDDAMGNMEPEAKYDSFKYAIAKTLSMYRLSNLKLIVLLLGNQFQ